MLTKGEESWTGTLESTLTWDNGLQKLPEFLVTSLPFTYAPSVGALDFLGNASTTALVSALDVAKLFHVCLGPEGSSIPESTPGSIRLSLGGY